MEEIEMALTDDEKMWDIIEEHGAPCKVNLFCDSKKTYTGPGEEYVDLWSIQDKKIPVDLEEIRRGKGNVLWGRLKDGFGWIDLRNVQLAE
ncbi:hypothetical protein [Fusicatenibacter saccharivorans]|uniref:hypothetical protein n=1 Tax=Fusicatenibacter saccharivorans TaxID=1150298 RepID=UPI003D034012